MILYAFFFPKQYEDDNRYSRTKDNYINEHEHALCLLLSIILYLTSLMMTDEARYRAVLYEHIKLLNKRATNGIA